MNYKQNEKINQVKESTLVVGIDIGSTKQYARAFDWRGIELGKVFTFSNSREGFEAFKAWMRHLQDKYRKSDVIAGIEPTGHYWFDLGAYLEDEGILLVMVNYSNQHAREIIGEEMEKISKITSRSALAATYLEEHKSRGTDEIPENLSEKMYDAIFSFKEKYAMFHSDADNLSQLLISVKIS